MRLRVAVTLALLPLLGLGCGGHGAASRSPASTTFAATECGTYGGRGCAPASKRADLRMPSFSHSTTITNPLFPISRLRSALLLGHVEGRPFRTETTLLTGAQKVTWDGRKVPVLVSQYVAYLNGRLEEVALDRYAQADDGSVWYFGEDVFDYKRGAVASTEGTWLAGREGPPAMIMPAEPRVGDVFRTENAPPIVFEEVSVKSVGETVAGPHGPVEGAIVCEELHSDGTHEDKTFAPGYGEFRTAGGGDLEALALATTTDALAGPPPPELRSLSTNVTGILGSVEARDWKAARAIIERVTADWRVLRTRKPPQMIAARMGVAIETLAAAVKARQPARAGQAVVDVLQSALDLELRHRAPAEIDRERFVLWTRQVQLDAAAGDLPGVTGDVATLEWIRDRIAQTLGAAGRREVDARLRGLRTATDAGNSPAAADEAARLAARVRTLAGQ